MPSVFEGPDLRSSPAREVAPASGATSRYEPQPAPVGEMPRNEWRGTMVEAVRKAEQGGVSAFASADWAKQSTLRVMTPGELVQTVERVTAQLGRGQEQPRVYTVGENGTIYNTATKRAEYVPVRERSQPAAPAAERPSAEPSPKPADGAARDKAPQPATLATLTNVSPTTAPREINLSAFNSVYTKEWGKSFPNGITGTVYERGATVTADKSGTLHAVNEGAGLNSQSGSFSPDLAVPAGQTVRGVIHTHPYSYADGYSAANPPPRNVAPSGGDAAYLINKGQDLIIAVGADTQSMYLRTSATPAHVDFTAVNNNFNNQVGVKMASGMSFEAACHAQAIETADKYGLVYYEGKNGQLTRQN